MSALPAHAAPQLMSSPAEAQAAAAHINEVMDALLALVEHETELVRAGKVGEAARLEQSKTDLARLYIADAQALNANQRFIEMHQPGLMKQLRHRHDTFHALLQINLTVLATAHAVSESLIRGVSAEVARKTQPQVYGASGRHAVARSGASAPVAVTKSL